MCARQSGGSIGGGEAGGALGGAVGGSVGGFVGGSGGVTGGTVGGSESSGPGPTDAKGAVEGGSKPPMGGVSGTCSTTKSDGTLGSLDMAPP